MNRGNTCSTGGFTLIEVLVAVAILAGVMTVTFLTFSTATMAWRRGAALSDDLHHGDFVVEQVVMALRSAYYPDAGGASIENAEYGFTIDDEGDDAFSSDRISWVKLGGALVGKHCPFAGSPHRVEFFVEEDDDGEYSAAVKFWRVQGQDDEFDPDEDVDPIWIARRITGFNCRMQDPDEEVDEDTDEIAWIDEWDDTNRIPTAVEITLWLEPLDDDEPAIEMKRIVQIPTAHLSWGQGGRTPTSGGTSTDEANKSNKSDASDKSDKSDRSDPSDRPDSKRTPNLSPKPGGGR